MASTVYLQDTGSQAVTASLEGKVASSACGVSADTEPNWIPGPQHIRGQWQSIWLACEDGLSLKL